VDVREAAMKSIETTQPDADQRKITVKLHCPESVMINGDSSELEIIFNNLVSNAVKYNRDGGKVDVYIDKKEDDLVTIKVSDTGIGMTPEEKEKLFGEFVRIKNDKTRNIQGSGLGLSILKRLSSLYEGDVSVESEADVGSTFIVNLKNLPIEPSEK
jgi:signal transduction histidine kinase